MKKVIFVLCFTCLLYLNGIAQTKSVDVDNEWFTYGYRALPTNPFDPIDLNYATKVILSGGAKISVSIGEIENALFIAGQVKVDDPAEALLVVELSLGNVIVSSSDINERRVDSKDKAGNVKTTFYYKAVTKYSFESSYQVRKGKEVLLKGEPFTRSYVQTFETEEYDSRKAAADFWNNNRETLVAGFYHTLSLQSAKTASSNASSRYGFTPITGFRDIIKTIDEKKHNENVAFRAASDALRTSLQAMTPDKPLDKEKMDELIAYFKSIPEKYTDPKQKADVRIRYAALYNLCKIYLYLDEPENVPQYADLLYANGYDEKDGEKLNKAAAELKAVFEKTGIHTRHFNPDEYFSKPVE
jgi:hypothetical protein